MTPEQIKEIEREAEAKIAGLQTELTVWKDTAEKLKRENDELKESNARIAQNFAALQIRFGESESQLQQRDEYTHEANAKILSLFEQIKQRDELLDRANDAIDHLMSFQNGSPLPTYDKGWHEGMDKCQKFLTDYQKLKK